MATYTIIKLKNITPLHMGTGTENYDFSASELQSDTLSAALAAICAQNGKTEDLESFLNSFTISSAFPFVGDFCFLPKPQGKIEIEVRDGDEYVSRKKLKRLRFIESGLWQKIVAGETIKVLDSQLQGKFLLSSPINNDEAFEKPFVSQVNQRVSVPREDGKAEPFFFDWTYFKSDSGLFCIVNAKQELLNEIIELFKQLGDNGLGTDKNIGGGKFDVETAFISIPEIAQANSSMLLSLYIPTEAEVGLLDLENSRYELLQRGGYIAGSQETDFRHLRKKSVYMFNVGSIFNTTESLDGRIVDLKPEWNDKRMHPIYRSGKPIIVPIKM